MNGQQQLALVGLLAVLDRLGRVLVRRLELQALVEIAPRAEFGGAAWVALRDERQPWREPAH